MVSARHTTSRICSSRTGLRWSRIRIRIQLFQLWRSPGVRPTTCWKKLRRGIYSPLRAGGNSRMPSNPISRRDVLRTLAMGAVGGSVLQIIPLQAAEQIHHMVKKEKAQAPAGKYQPKFFSAHQYATLSALCDAIIPADDQSGGAVQAGAPEFIDLLTSENKDYQLSLGGGLMWLDGWCVDHYGNPYLTCNGDQRRETLDLIAYRKNVDKDAS